MTYKTDTTVWIDLEQTIIESWTDPRLVNVTKIRNFLRQRNITEVSIFSYAIWSVKDKSHFDLTIRPDIEAALDVKVLAWPSVQDMIREEKNFTGIRFDEACEVAEYIQLRGKPDGFRNYIQSVCDFRLAILIDDVVPNTTLTQRDKGWAIELWNVDSL